AGPEARGRHRRRRRGRRHRGARARPVHRPARRHGRPAHERRQRRRARLDQTRRLARLRPRRPHGDPAGRRPPPGGQSALARARRPDLPARRGERPGRQSHDRRRPVRPLSVRRNLRLSQHAPAAVRRGGGASRRDLERLQDLGHRHSGRRRPRRRPAQDQGSPTGRRPRRLGNLVHHRPSCRSDGTGPDHSDQAAGRRLAQRRAARSQSGGHPARHLVRGDRDHVAEASRHLRRRRRHDRLHCHGARDGGRAARLQR
ncbi:hypothetical protein LTR94_029409, partial [Friedmanniomyces endolithicus]